LQGLSASLPDIRTTDTIAPQGPNGETEDQGSKLNIKTAARDDETPGHERVKKLRARVEAPNRTAIVIWSAVTIALAGGGIYCWQNQKQIYALLQASAAPPAGPAPIQSANPGKPGFVQAPATPPSNPAKSPLRQFQSAPAPPDKGKLPL